jgi:glutamate-1-semialdehyde 2,1-aminomutase
LLPRSFGFFLIQAEVEPLLFVHKQPRLRQEQLKILCWQKYNDLENVATLIEANKNEIAAIIVEPVAGIWVVFRPIKSFGGLRQLCTDNGFY